MLAAFTTLSTVFPISASNVIKGTAADTCEDWLGARGLHHLPYLAPNLFTSTDLCRRKSTLLFRNLTPGSPTQSLRSSTALSQPFPGEPSMPLISLRAGTFPTGLAHSENVSVYRRQHKVFRKCKQVMSRFHGKRPNGSTWQNKIPDLWDTTGPA